MRAIPAHRKVLIIEDEPAIRNLLYVLLAGLGYESDIAHGGRQALTMIGREGFDAVLLDLRCANAPLEQVISGIKQIRPNLVGRVLVVTGEVTDRKSLEMIERYCLPQVSRNRLLQDFWERMRVLVGPSLPLESDSPPLHDR